MTLQQIIDTLDEAVVSNLEARPVRGESKVLYRLYAVERAARFQTARDILTLVQQMMDLTPVEHPGCEACTPADRTLNVSSWREGEQATTGKARFCPHCGRYLVVDKGAAKHEGQ